MAFLFKQVKKSRKVIKTQSSQEVLDKLQGFLDASLEEAVTILAGFWEDQQNAVTYQEIRQALLDGTLTTDYIDLWQQDYSKLVTDKLAPVWEKAMKAGASGIKDMLDASQIELNSWGINNWVASHGGEFITVITGEQKAAARFFIEQSIQGKYTVDELSRVIRPCVGLNEKQAKANLNYYNHVKESLKKDHPRMKAKSIEGKAHEAAVKYAEKQHRSRAFMIAQTELAFAYNKGTDDGIRQAQAQNLLGIMEKRWSTSGDANVCKICAALDGVQISMDEEFDFPGRVLYDGHKLTPPAHPRCACAVQYIEISPPEIDGGLIEYRDNDNADYLVRDHVPGEDTTDERLVVSQAISEVPEKVQQAIHDGTIIDVGKTGASQYDYNNDILYVAKGAGKEDVIHEIGHMVENKMMDSLKVAQLIEGATVEVTVFDVDSSIYYDTADNPVEIFSVYSDKFISEYQGRLYIDDIFSAFDSATGKLKKEYLMEFISEAFRVYHTDKKLLKRKYQELYEYIKEVVE